MTLQEQLEALAAEAERGGDPDLAVALLVIAGARWSGRLPLLIPTLTAFSEQELRILNAALGAAQN